MVYLMLMEIQDLESFIELIKKPVDCLVVAKNNLAHSNLGKQFSDHSIKRKYQCLAVGDDSEPFTVDV